MASKKNSAGGKSTLGGKKQPVLFCEGVTLKDHAGAEIVDLERRVIRQRRISSAPAIESRRSGDAIMRGGASLHDLVGAGQERERDGEA